ncbi:MAG TPA: HlyD family efflux transporter periplasmic adaptor subunit [Terriglobales bacterium]|nr:HlyD family efflux transporter periplasmic adaptor subunit [Terriglobales bacterium]
MKFKRKFKSRAVRAALALIVVGALIYGANAAVQGLRGPSKPPIPSARVHRGDIDIRIYTVGDLRPVRAVMLAAPPTNGNLQIVDLARSGSQIKKGATVVEFDPSEQEYKLEQSQFDLNAAEQNLAKSNADAAVQASEDKLALLKARFDVRKAELDVSKNELLSSIDAQKNNLALQEARRKLAQLEQDIKSHDAANQASIAVLKEKQAKSQLEVQQARTAIAGMTLPAPFDGAVSVQDNWDATGGFFTTGMVLPEYRAGDQVRSGRAIAQVLEGTMELQVRLEESARANINPGQKVQIAVDGIPGATFDGAVKTIASLASRGGFFGSDPTRRFDATFQINSNDSRLRPGETARVTITGNHLKNVLLLPRQAVFNRDGKEIVYLKNGSSWVPRDVKVTNRTEGQVIIEGLDEGAEVALANPDEKPASSGGNGK